ncbi:hypothetical protein D3C87_664190 [compost metagenome]
MNTISINDQPFTAPQNWSEMGQAELLKWVKIIHKQLSRTDAFALAVITFYKIKPRLYFKLEPAHHVQLKNTVAFLAEENLLNRWLIPSIKVSTFTRFYGPEDYLSSSTIKEFRFCELFYHNYARTKKTEFLDKLIATLFRPKGNCDVDDRDKLTRSIIAKNCRKVTKLAVHEKHAILFNYEGCRNAIFKAYPKIFKSNGTDAKSNETPDLENIINVVSGGKFGTFIQTEETLIYRFLDHLENEIEENQKR